MGADHMDLSGRYASPWPAHEARRSDSTAYASHPLHSRPLTEEGHQDGNEAEHQHVRRAHDQPQRTRPPHPPHARRLALERQLDVRKHGARVHLPRGHHVQEHQHIADHGHGGAREVKQHVVGDGDPIGSKA